MNTDIAIARDLVREGGLDQKAADAVAQKIVTHTDENHATNADLAKLEGRLDTKIGRLDIRITGLETKVNIVIGLNVAILLFILTNSIGG